jgi:hypothetical protein
MLARIAYNPAIPSYRSVRFYVIALILATNVLNTSAQDSDSLMTSADDVFTMKVTRENSEVIINLSFIDSSKFKYVLIEREADFDQNFSQIKYITYKEIMRAPNHHLKTEDAYPFPPATDVLYRLKIITTEDAVRIYPPVSLPGDNH